MLDGVPRKGVACSVGTTTTTTKETTDRKWCSAPPKKSSQGLQHHRDRHASVRRRRRPGSLPFLILLSIAASGQALLQPQQPRWLHRGLRTARTSRLPFLLASTLPSPWRWAPHHATSSSSDPALEHGGPGVALQTNVVDSAPSPRRRNVAIDTAATHLVPPTTVTTAPVSESHADTITTTHNSNSSNNNNNNNNPPLSWMLRLEETSRRLEEQVTHLTGAVQALQRTVERQSSSHSHSRSHSTITNTAPMAGSVSQLLTRPRDNDNDSRTPSTTNTQKTVKLLIDGTWLYYSLYERRGPECPIARRFGRDWPLRYTVNWAQLPQLVESHLQRQLGKNDATTPDVTVTSSTVFTSYKADTSPISWRFKMFEGMKRAGYRVHMMETLGKLEKCVDIALAVELLHAECDIALLLTGDKDFLPAMIRARTPHKKQLGLVSIRGSCNRALYEPPKGELLDFGVIWLEDYMEDLLVLREGGHDPGRRSGDSSSATALSLFTIMKILNDYIERSGVGKVNSRDVGRYLKFLRTGPSTVSEELKKSHGGLRQMLRVLPDVYTITFPDEDAEEDKAFWIELTDTAGERLAQVAQSTVLTTADKEFLERYTLQPLEDKQVAYWYTLQGEQTTTESQQQTGIVVPQAIPDYSSWTVVQLKEFCRERNLPVSGTKAALLERIHAHLSRPSHPKPPESDDTPGRLGFPAAAPPKETSDYLVGLLTEYLRANDGTAGSRNVGRYLAANKPSKPDWWISALQELKSYGTLSEFLQSHDDIFGVEETNDLVNGFSITLKKGAASTSGTSY